MMPHIRKHLHKQDKYWLVFRKCGIKREA